MKNIFALLCAAIFFLFLCSPVLGTDLFSLRGSIGYEVSDNFIYSPAISAEGAETGRRGSFELAVSPQLLPWLAARAGLGLSMDEYSVRPEYNTTGNIGFLDIEIGLFTESFLYLMFSSSSYNIGSKTSYYNRSAGAQYMFDLSRSGSFWTTLFYENNDEGFDSSLYEQMNNTNQVVGVRQHFTENFYLFADSTDLKADGEYFSYVQSSLSSALSFQGLFGLQYSIVGTLEDRFYKESILPGFLPKREDRKASVLFSITKDVFAGISLSMSLKHTANRSNMTKDDPPIGYGNYQENVIGINLNLEI